MTAADHANTVREGLRGDYGPGGDEALAALDALQTQAETAAGAQHVRESLVAEADACRERMEAAEAERERLREERDALRESGQRWAENVRGKEQRIVAAEAERDQARDALRQIADLDSRYNELAIEIARAALGNKP